MIEVCLADCFTQVLLWNLLFSSTDLVSRYVEKIEVVTCTTNSQATFPVLRWIRAKDQFKLAKFDMALPKFEKYSKQRAQELERKREVYQLVEMVPGAPKQIAQLPNDERFSHDYKVS